MGFTETNTGFKMIKFQVPCKKNKTNSDVCSQNEWMDGHPWNLNFILEVETLFKNI